MDRRDKTKQPRPEMTWSEKHQMWVDPDTRTPEQKAKDEAIATEIEERIKTSHEYLLWPLLTPEFAASVMASTPAFQLARMRKTSEVRAISDAYITKALAPEVIRKFVRGLLDNNPPVSDTVFPYEDALSAIAAALSESPGDPFAREYVQELSLLEVRGFELCNRVAKACWKEMKEAL
jgi:hypothetical protein